MGVILCDCSAEDAFRREAELRVPATAEVWKDSFRRSRWCTTLYRLRKASVLWEAGGKRDGLDVILPLSLAC